MVEARVATAPVLAVMCLGTFMAILDTSLVNLGLKTIQQDLHAEMATLQWVIDLYNLAYAALIITGGTLGDLYGRRRVFLIGVGVFAAGSLVCAVAPNAVVLVLGRGIAGAGAAFLLPVALAILNVTYPDPRARARAIAIWGGMNGLAMAIGPTLGGVLVDAFGWRSLFYAVLPVAGVALAIAPASVPESSDPKGRTLDLGGQVLAVLTLGTLCLGFIQGPSWGWQSWRLLLCAAGFAASAVAFLFVERASASPLIPLAMFRNRAFSAAIADATLMTFGMYGLLFVLPLFLQSIRGATATLAGLELLPMSVTFFIVSLGAGRAVAALGPRILISVGMCLTGGGLFMLAAVSQQSGYAIIAAALFAVGLGLGLITGPIATAAVANAPVARSGTSSGLVNVGRMVGATLGVAILGILFGAHIEETARDPARFLEALRAAFLIGGAAQLCGALIALICFHRGALEGPQRRPGAAASASPHAD
jgi:MFS transporter, DHA2 family, methylenomycin A resistance protein